MRSKTLSIHSGRSLVHRRPHHTIWTLQSASSMDSETTTTSPSPPSRTASSFPTGSTLVLTDPETSCEVVLLGCFHGSQSSSEDVTSCLSVSTQVTDQNKEQHRNVVVALELCATRFADLRRDVQEERDATLVNHVKQAKRNRPWVVRFAEMVQSTIQQRGLSTGLAAALLGGVSGIQTALSGLQPGLEFRTALVEVLDVPPQDPARTIVLADKNVDETLDSIGQIPLVALNLWKSCLWDPSETWQSTFGVEAAALGRAVGLVFPSKDKNDDPPIPTVTLGGFATRSPRAILDLTRLLLPPVVALQGSVLAVNGVFEWLHQQPEWLEAAADAATVTSSNNDAMTTMWAWSNVIFLTALYVSVALPAVRVILRERDDILTTNIRQACRLATQHGTQPGRVVAVLGLLHVNGVAQRLLQSSNHELDVVSSPELNSDTLINVAHEGREMETRQEQNQQ